MRAAPRGRSKARGSAAGAAGGSVGNCVMIGLNRPQVLPIGVDIGCDSVKMLQLEVVGRSLSVLAAARRALPEEARADAGLRLLTALDVVRQMLRQHEFRGRSIVTSLPREIVHVKNLRLPKIPPAELDAAVQFEARNVFPFDTDQARVCHLHAGEVRQGTETKEELIVLAARHEDVNALLERLHAGGCVVESLDFEPSAIYRSVERFIRRREDEQEVHVLVDVGLRGTQVIIGRGREMSFFKPIEVGGQHFHEAVSRKLGITTTEARELRRRMVGDAAGGAVTVSELRKDPVRQAVLDATRSLTEELAREISLCLRYHSVTFRGHRPLKLRLIGGEAADPQLQSILGSVLPIPVEATRPMYSVDTTRMPPAERRGRLGEWTVAFGLGLKTTRDYFGARDGKQRAEPAPHQPGIGGAEVVDLARAVQGDEGARTSTTSPAAAAAATATATATNTNPTTTTTTATATGRPEEALHA